MFKVNGVSVQLPNKEMIEDFQQFREEGNSIIHSLLLAERRLIDNNNKNNSRP